MSFLSPLRLLLLLPLACLVAAYLVAQRRRPSYAVRFTELDLLASVAGRAPGWRRHVPAALLLLSLATLTAAFARPVAEVGVPRERATVLVAVDTSLSMQATDVDPDRITAARRAAAQFVRSLPPRFSVGLVSFSGTVSLVVPPTQDHEQVAQAAGSLTLGPGTAIGQAVLSSLEAIAAVPGEPGQAPPPARIVLLSDGANTVGRSVAQAEAAASSAGVPVSTIAYGTPDGVVVVEGQRIPVPVDAPALADLADRTGGTAFSAQSGDQLDRVYQDIGSSVGTVRERREVTDLATGLGLALAAGAAVLALLWTSRIP